MENKNLAFGRMNYIIIGISVLLITIGFVLMTGSGSTDKEFNPDIFSHTRIVVAPFISFVGFLLVVVGILFKRKEK